MRFSFFNLFTNTWTSFLASWDGLGYVNCWVESGIVELRRRIVASGGVASRR
jgi:hypothetical protein